MYVCVYTHSVALCAGGLCCRHIEFPFSFYADVDTRCCYERRGVAASTRIPDPDEITVDTSDVQVSATGVELPHPTLYLLDIPPGNAGRICIFLQPRRWSNVYQPYSADRRAGQRPALLPSTLPRGCRYPVIAFGVYVKTRHSEGK